MADEHVEKGIFGRKKARNTPSDPQAPPSADAQKKQGSPIEQPSPQRQEKPTGELGKIMGASNIGLRATGAGPSASRKGTFEIPSAGGDTTASADVKMDPPEYQRTDTMSNSDDIAGKLGRGAVNTNYKAGRNLTEGPAPYYADSEHQAERAQEIKDEEDRKQADAKHRENLESVAEKGAEMISSRAKEEMDANGGSIIDKEARDKAAAEAQAAKKQKYSDYAKVLGYDLGVAGMGLGAGLTQTAERLYGTLVNINNALFQGHPMGIGSTIGESIVDGGMSLKPTMDSIARLHGINERNGTIDPEAVGTGRGLMYYQDKRRLDSFNVNTNKWLESYLGEGATTGNVLQRIDALDPGQRREFMDDLSRKVDAERDRLYAKADRGKLDQVDQALLDAYTKVAEGMRMAETWTGREMHAQGAMGATQAQQMETQMRIGKERHRIAVRRMMDRVDSSDYKDSRNRAMFHAIQDRLYNDTDGRMGMAKYIITAPNGDWKVDESKLGRQEWTKIRHELEDKVDQHRNGRGPGLDGDEMALLYQARSYFNSTQMDRMENKMNDLYARAAGWQRRYGIDPQSSVTDRMLMKRLQNGNIRPPDLNGLNVPGKETGEEGRRAWKDGTVADIDRVKKNWAKNKGNGKLPYDPNVDWYGYLANGDVSDPDYWTGVMAQNTRLALELTDLVDGSRRMVEGLGSGALNDFQDELAGIEDAARQVMKGRAMSSLDLPFPGDYGDRVDYLAALEDYRFRSGVDDAAKSFINRYNDLNELILSRKIDALGQREGTKEEIAAYDDRKSRIDEEHHKQYPVIYYDKDGEDGMGEENEKKGKYDSESIFGPTVERPINEELNGEASEDTNLDNYSKVDETIISSVSASATIDAEGLSFGELFPIVKSRLGLDDEDAEEFICTRMRNVGFIDSKDDLLREIRKASSDPPTEEEIDTFTNWIPRTQNSGSAAWPPKRDGDPSEAEGSPIQVSQPQTPQPQIPRPQIPSVASHEDIIGNVYGKTTSDTNKRKKLANAVKDIVRDYETGGTLSHQDRYWLDNLNEEFERLTGGKRLFDPNMLRGDEGAKLRSLYGDGTVDARVKRYLGRYDLDDSYGKAARLMMDRGLGTDPATLYLYTKGRGERAPFVPRTKESIDSTYGVQYGYFKNLLDNYISDPETYDRLMGIWRNYVGSAIRGYNTSSEGLFHTSNVKEPSKGLDARLNRLVNGLSDSEKAFYKEQYGDIADRYIRDYANGSFVPMADVGGNSYIRRISDEISDRMGHQISRMGYDIGRKKGFKDVVGGLSPLGVREGDLNGKTPEEIKEYIAQKGHTYGSKGEKRLDNLNGIINNIESRWGEVVSKNSYKPDKGQEWMRTDPSFIGSEEDWKAMQANYKSILNGLKEARRRITGGAPVPNAQRPRRKLKVQDQGNIFENMLDNENWFVNDATVDNTKDMENTFTNVKLRPLFDLYTRSKGLEGEDRLKAMARIADAVSSFSDEDLLAFKTWEGVMLNRLMRFIESRKFPDQYKANLKQYQATGKDASGKPMPKYYSEYTVNQFSTIYNRRDLLQFFRDVVKEEDAKRGRLYRVGGELRRHSEDGV